MPVPDSLNVHRHDSRNQAVITLAGEIDLDSAPLVRESLAQCLRDGIRTIEVDVTTVTFCDCSGVNAFLEAYERVTVAGGSLRLHHPCPMLARLLRILTGTGLPLWLHGSGRGEPAAWRGGAAPRAGSAW